MTRMLRGLLRLRRGSVTLEFALVGSTFLTLLLFLLGASLLFWAKGVMQMAAWNTARCAAIGSSACSNPQTYATSIMNTWGVSGIVPSINVTVQSGAMCSSAAGLFTMATISGTGGIAGGFVAPLSNMVLTASACYPSPSTTGGTGQSGNVSGGGKGSGNGSGSDDSGGSKGSGSDN